MVSNHAFLSSIFYVLLLINFFLPTWNVFLKDKGELGFIIISFSIFFFSALYLTWVLRSQKWVINSKFNLVLLAFITYFFQMLVSSLLNESLIVGDLFEFIRPINYLLMTLLGGYIVLTKVVNLDNLVKILSYYIFFTALLSTVSILFHSAFGEALMGLYAKESLVKSLRFAGTYNNPYDYAFLFSLAYSYFLINFINSGKLKFLLIILVLCIALVFSQSKSGFGIFVFCSGAVLATNVLFSKSGEVSSRSGRAFRTNIILTLIIIAFTSFLFFFKDDFLYLYAGVTKILLGEGDKSTNIRIDQLTFYLGLLEDSPLRAIIGFGSSKSNNYFFESLYSLYFYRYGLTGVFLIAFYILLPLCLLFYSTLKRNYSMKGSTSLILILFFSSAAISGLGNNVIDQNRVSLPFFLILGALFASLVRQSSDLIDCDQIDMKGA